MRRSNSTSDFIGLMSNTSLPTSFVINLPRDKERRETMAARLDKLGLPYEIFEAVNGYELKPEELGFYDSKKRCRYFGRDLEPGELGCLLSHYKIYQKMVADNIEHAVILEDDVIFEDNFPHVLEALLETKVPWDVIRFLGSKKIYKRGCRKIVPLVGEYWLARLPTAPGGAHGYLITLRAAHIMLKHMQKNWMPIDTLQGRTWETGLETLVTHPAPLYPDERAGSTIGDARFDKTVTLQGWERKLFPLFRGWFKLNETLGKKYTYLSSWFRDTRAKANYKV